jgi:hypothetical protein
MTQAIIEAELRAALCGARRVLEGLGYRPDPFVLALALWTGGRIERGLTTAERRRFQALHVEACAVLGVSPHPADLTPPGPRNEGARAFYLAHANALARLAYERALSLVERKPPTERTRP